MFVVYVARRAFVVVHLLHVVLDVLLVQDTIKAFEFEFVKTAYCMCIILRCVNMFFPQESCTCITMEIKNLSK